MSMNAVFVQVDSDELSSFEADPASVEALFDDEAAASGERPILSLDKDWHGVHYLLCGKAEPGRDLLSQAVMGGVDIGDDDEGFSGYGPARGFAPDLVAELAKALSEPQLKSQATARFVAERMTQLGIYPGWRASDADQAMNGVRRLRDFYGDAAAKGQAIVTCLL